MSNSDVIILTGAMAGATLFLGALVSSLAGLARKARAARRPRRPRAGSMRWRCLRCGYEEPAPDVSRPETVVDWLKATTEVHAVVCENEDSDHPRGTGFLEVDDPAYVSWLVNSGALAGKLTWREL